MLFTMRGATGHKRCYRQAVRTPPRRLVPNFVAGATKFGTNRRAAMKVMEFVYVKLEPGDVLFFHSNTLHRSDQNKSPNPRWSMLCCYNTKHNNPYKESHHPFYEPLVKVPDSRLREMGVKLFSEGAEFWNPARDHTVASRPT